MPDPASTASNPPWETRRHSPRPGRLRRLLSWAVGLVLLGLLVFGIMPKPVEVEIAAAFRGPLTVHVIEEGKTRIRNRFVISAPVAGQLRRVALKAGDAVKAGETILAVVEPSAAPLLDPRANAQAEARVAAATAGKQRAEQTLEMAKTAAAFAKTNWDRVSKTSGTISISASERDAAQRDALMRDREVHAGEFALQVANFELEQAKVMLRQFHGAESAAGDVVEMRSPVSGQVLRVVQESAVAVAPGSAILEVGDPADIEIEAEILSRDAVAIQPGAEVNVEQWGGEPLKARVRRVEPAAFTKISALGVEEQRVIVLADLVHPPAAVPVMGDRFRVEVKVAVWHRDDTLLAPAGALFREGSEWKTYRLTGGRAVKTAVETGRTDGRFTEITNGLQPGMEVLLYPPDTVTDGTRVKKRG